MTRDVTVKTSAPFTAVSEPGITEPANHTAARDPARLEALRRPYAEREKLLRAFLDKVEHRRRLGGTSDQAIEIEIAALIRLLPRLTLTEFAKQRPFFELASDILASENPDLNLIRGLRNQLEVAEQRRGKGFFRLIIRLCGPIPEWALFVGIFSVFLIVSMIFFLFVVGYPHLVKMEKAMPEPHLFTDIFAALPLIDLLVIISASFIGSIVSMLVSMGSFTDKMYEPLMLYITTVSKPFIAMLFCLFIFSVLRSDLVDFFGIRIEGPTGLYLLWVIGFLCGFSERFVDRFITGAESHLGKFGMKNENPGSHPGQNGS